MGHRANWLPVYSSSLSKTCQLDNWTPTIVKTNQPTNQATTPEHLTDYICTRLGLERSAGILPYADCFGSTFVCVYVLCLYIHMNSPCLGLELYGKRYKRQMKLFWTNWNHYLVASQVRLNSHAWELKGGTPGIFPLLARLAIWDLSVSRDFNILWKINVLNSVPSALQRNRKRVG